MTLTDAINMIARSSGSTNATKRPSWTGYVYVTDYDSETRNYTLHFKNREGTIYNFDFNAASGAYSQASETALPLDMDLFAAFLATDWQVGASSDFEISRAGNGTW